MVALMAETLVVETVAKGVVLMVVMWVECLVEQMAVSLVQW